MDPSSPQSPIDRLLALGGELTAPAIPGEPRRKYELAHMRTLLSALGDPQLRFRSVLIAGTNGKGSTAATLASILQAAGHRVGLYTSPHLERPNERIRHSGEAISDVCLSTLFLQVEVASATLVRSGALPYTPSFFETMTAIAFLAFAGQEGASAKEAPVDLAVLEVGLGGRLDATNVVDPLLSILTDISLDHENWLGFTIAAITREKAGILRPGGVLVTLPQHPEANQAIGEVAVPLALHAVNAAEYLPMRGPAETVAAATPVLRSRYVVTMPGPAFAGRLLQVDSPLFGGHQQRNIALAIAAAVTLHERFSFELDLEALQHGIHDTVWPGRLQWLAPAETHLAPVLLDAAHNPAGAWALRAALSTWDMSGPRTLVFACMADKAIGELAQVLFPVFDEVLLTKAKTVRAAELSALAAAAERTGTASRIFPNSADALEAARLVTPAHGLIVVAGSIALLGEAARFFRGIRHYRGH